MMKLITRKFSLINNGFPGNTPGGYLLQDHSEHHFPPKHAYKKVNCNSQSFHINTTAIKHFINRQGRKGFFN